MRATGRSELTRAELSARIDTLGWGALFVALGGVGLVPDLPKDAWLIAVGVVMVGVSATRARLRLSVSGVTTVVGVLALAAGLGSIAGLARATWPAILVVLGLTLVVGALYRSHWPTDVTSPSHGG